MMDFSGDHEIEHFRRSLAMLPAGADALKREEAMVLLGRLRDATARLRRVAGQGDATLTARAARAPPRLACARLGGTAGARAEVGGVAGEARPQRRAAFF